MNRFLLPFFLLTLTFCLQHTLISQQDYLPPQPIGGECLIDTLVSGHDVDQPLSLAFAKRDNGVFFFTEKNRGRVRIVERGRLNPTPFVSLHVSTSDERGALGVAAHPYYPDSPYVYVLYNRLGDRANLVVRYRDSSAIGVDPQIIFAAPRLGVNSIHGGGSISVGPDEKLYVSISEFHKTEKLEKNPTGGIVFRLELNGGIPDDSAEEGNPEWWYAEPGIVRFAFNSAAGVAYRTGENIGFRSTGSYPVRQGLVATSRESGTDSLRRFQCIAFYEGDGFPILRNSLLAVTSHDSSLWILQTSKTGEEVISVRRNEFPFISDGYRDIAVGPAGGIYVITNAGSIVRIRPSPPYFLSTPSGLATQDILYSYVPILGGTPATVTVQSAPVGFGYNPNDRSMRWTPTNKQALQGSHAVTVLAENGAGSVEQTFMIRVANVNDPPAIVTPIGPAGDTTITFRGTNPLVTFSWEAGSDPDGDSLVYSFQADTLDSFAKPLLARNSISGTYLTVGLPTTSQSYYWKVTASDGKKVSSGEQARRLSIVYASPAKKTSDMEEREAESILEQNFPNPFNPATSIKYTIPKGGHVHLGVFNMLGQEVAIIFDGTQTAGTHEIEFKNPELPSGIYFYRIQSPEFVETRKMVIAK